MSSKRIQVLPVNRVEGDLKIRIEVEDNHVTEAFSIGMMYRGIEKIMLDRGPLDGLVITPRICGICSNSHLAAAAMALDDFYKAEVPPNAVRVRNVSLCVESIQNDIRHAFLLFMPDFTNPAYADHPLYQDALTRYEPLKGDSTVAAVRETKRLLEVIAIMGGQWPHSSFIVPGGVVSVISVSDIAQCRYLLGQFRKWFEANVLACSIEEWLSVESLADLQSWLVKDPAHQHGDLGFFVRFCERAGLDRLGADTGRFLSFGSLPTPGGRADKSGRSGFLIPAGLVGQDRGEDFDGGLISEDISHSHFDGAPSTHPFDADVTPKKPLLEGMAYSWAKAPRYDGLPAETGPLAQLLVSKNPLFVDLLNCFGPSVYVRELARLTRAAHQISHMERWLGEIASDNGEFYHQHGNVMDGQGCGLVEAPRGALGHWVRIEEGVIAGYQVITPTTWNASPRDVDGNRGPMEQALIGVRVKDPENPIEVAHVIRSFDPCLVCTVHAVDLKKGQALPPKTIG